MLKCMQDSGVKNVTNESIPSVYRKGVMGHLEQPL